ncbi:MAG: hypothetical protein LBP61_07230, partial [Desulfovibrio sp.]|nr:hypothetical protein [Desulfovibrio sp.]
ERSSQGQGQIRLPVSYVTSGDFLQAPSHLVKFHSQRRRTLFPYIKIKYIAYFSAILTDISIAPDQMREERSAMPIGPTLTDEEQEFVRTLAEKLPPVIARKRIDRFLGLVLPPDHLTKVLPARKNSVSPDCCRAGAPSGKRRRAGAPPRTPPGHIFSSQVAFKLV